MLHGSINHVSITVSNLPQAMQFFAPLLEFLGFTVGGMQHDAPAATELTANINAANGTAFNIWQATPPSLIIRSRCTSPGCITSSSTSSDTSRSTRRTRWCVGWALRSLTARASFRPVRAATTRCTFAAPTASSSRSYTCRWPSSATGRAWRREGQRAGKRRRRGDRREAGVRHIDRGMNSPAQSTQVG